MNVGKSVLTVSRKWNNPRIVVWVNDEEIGMGMSLDDLLVALAAEMGNPALILTNAQLLDRLRKAANLVESGVKEQSSVVI